MSIDDAECSMCNDRELWSEVPGDYYSPASVHVTEHGGIGIKSHGRVIVKTPVEWHALYDRVAELKDISEASPEEFVVPRASRKVLGRGTISFPAKHPKTS